MILAGKKGVTKRIIGLAATALLIIMILSFIVPPFLPNPNADSIEEAVHAVSSWKDAKIEYQAETDNFAMAFCISSGDKMNLILCKQDNKWSVLKNQFMSCKKRIRGSLGDEFFQDYYIEYYIINKKELLYISTHDAYNTKVSVSDSLSSPFSSYTRTYPFAQFMHRDDYYLVEFDRLPENYSITIGDKTIPIN